MLGHKQFVPKMYYSLSLDKLVAEDSFYRHLNALLDLGFLYPACKPHYGRTGNPSIDPVVFFKMCLYGYLEGIVSDRQLAKRLNDSLEARWFIGYDLDEVIPWHSTISRTRQKLPVKLYEELFKRILGMCVSSGLVSGEMISIDSTLVKANASLDRMVYKEPVLQVEDYLSKSLLENQPSQKTIKNQIDDSDQNDETEGDSKNLKVIQQDELPKRKMSNMRYQSSTDADSRVARKPGFRSDLYYTDQLAVDNKNGIITAVLGTRSDIQDSDCLFPLIDRSKKNLEPFRVKIRGVVTDSHYVSGENLLKLALDKLEAYMPIQSRGNPTGGLTKAQFIYDQQANEYSCPGNKRLKHTSTAHKQDAWIYTATKADCDACALKAQCAPGIAPRKITRSFFADYVDQMKAKMGTRAYKKALRNRQTTVEGKFAEAKQNHALKRVRARGLPAAQKEFLMIACVQNLKKYVKYGFRPVQSALSQLNILVKHSTKSLIHFILFLLHPKYEMSYQLHN